MFESNLFCLIFSLFSFNKYKNTGNVQTFTAPCSANYKLEVWGAQGGNYESMSGGKGGYSIGNKNLNSSNNLYVCVGGTGGTYSGNTGGSAGYNGGGKGGNGYQGDYQHIIPGGAGGGGATHIAITTNRGVLKNYINNKSEIILVAGGGGGVIVWGDAGGIGGGTNGGNVASYGNVYSCSGATQSSGYSFGQGQDGKTKTQGGSYGSEGNGGGGGGWYGGPTIQNMGNYSDCSGTGGSGYIGGVTNGTTTAGIQSGNGKALITWMPVL